MRARLLIAIASLLYALTVQAKPFPESPTSDELVDLLYAENPQILRTEITKVGNAPISVTVVASPKYGLVTCFQVMGGHGALCYGGDETGDPLNILEDKKE